MRARIYFAMQAAMAAIRRGDVATAVGEFDRAAAMSQDLPAGDPLVVALDEAASLMQAMPSTLGGATPSDSAREYTGLLRTKSDADDAPAESAARILTARLPASAPVGRRLSLIVSIAAAPPDGQPSSRLKPLEIPAGGATVTIVVSAPGLVPQGEVEHDLHVPATGDSEPHRFSFVAGPAGLHTVTVEAYRGGTFLGSLRLQVSVEVGAAAVIDGPVTIAELVSLAVEPGEVTLQVSRSAESYTFQLLGDPWCPPEHGRLAGDPGPIVSRIASELRAMAAGRSDFCTPALVRSRLRNLGVQLWSSVVPQAVQAQFWEQADRIKTFTIASEQDVIPWELLYPMDGDRDRGFLAERFPVVRRVYGPRRVLRLPMNSAAYIVPPNSPRNALDEVAAIRARLGATVGNRGVLARLDELQQLLEDVPGVLHFACHNSFSDDLGSSIMLDGGPWAPIDLAVAVQRRAMAATSPLVFFNACRSAGEAAWLSEMMGWAKRFIQAGAGAFIGSLWAVNSSTAREFAETFYEAFVGDGLPLGTASLQARRAIADQTGDPTWLAYTVYGNPAALAACSART